MNPFLKNYSSTLLLVCFLALGALTGVFWPQAASYVKPIGDIFMNLLFVLIIPLVFFSVSTSFRKMNDGGSVKKTLTLMFLSFMALWLFSALFAYLGVTLINPLDQMSSNMARPEINQDGGSWQDSLSGAFTVDDFPKLFSKFSLLPLIVFSALIGLGVSRSGEKGKRFSDFLESGTSVTESTMSYLMKLAPLGLGCYFAYTVSSVGSDLLKGYLRSYLLYLALSLIVIFIVFPLVVRLLRGRGSVKEWWRHILHPSLTAMATQSSCAAIPGNIEAAKRMGISGTIAETIIPVGTNLLKAGSVMGGVIKVAFLMSLCSITYLSPGAAATAISLAILSAVVTGAVIGGNVTGEILTCTMLGIDPGYAGLIIIIGTIIDMPATFINSQSTVIAAIMVDKGTRSKEQANS